MEARGELPITTLVELSAYNAQDLGDKIALVFKDRHTSFAAFDAHTNQIANGLIAAGLKKDDRISFLGRNSDHYFELLFGAMKAGIVVAPIGWRLAEPEVVTILRNSEAQLLFVETELLRPAYSGDGLPFMRAIMPVNDADGAFIAWRDSQSTHRPAVRIDPEDVAVQIYTSGTTGAPKGAMLTHANFVKMRAIMSTSGGEANKYYPDDIALLAMPVSHVGGTATGIWALYGGIKSIVAPQFAPDDVIGFIRDEGVNNFFLVPAALQTIARDPRAATTDFSRIRAITYGGSPIPRKLLAELLEVFGCGFMQGYGMTETAATIVVLLPEEHLGDAPKLNSCGKPLPGVKLQIRGVDGTILAPGKVGEINVLSPGNMKGYWRDPEATAKALDKDGWLATGDAGYLDEDGYLYISDRVKDMIVSGGENIYPAEVENAIYGHPGVAEVAVVGVPSERWGEEVKAVIVRKSGSDVTAEDIMAWARERIAGFKVPKSVDFLEALPKSTAGKTLRRNIRAPYWADREKVI